MFLTLDLIFVRTFGLNLSILRTMKNNQLNMRRLDRYIAIGEKYTLCCYSHEMKKVNKILIVSIY